MLLLLLLVVVGEVPVVASVLERLLGLSFVVVADLIDSDCCDYDCCDDVVLA